MTQTRFAKVQVAGRFDRLLSAELRFLQEASRWGPVHVHLWSDALIEQRTGQAPKFPEAERTYVLDAIRYVDQVTLCQALTAETSLPSGVAMEGALWVECQEGDLPAKRRWCEQQGAGYRVIPDHTLTLIPESEPLDTVASGDAPKKVLVTGCYDWFHSGHVRFFEEVSQYGQLYVVVGHDANIRLLKGEGHPLFPATQRRFIVGSVTHVHRALISTGDGWLDAEPEIEVIKPDIYAVNEDGDRPEKRDYCVTHGIEYLVLKRTPKEGLPRRQSTDLRGF